jgi:hypothetical protein
LLNQVALGELTWHDITSIHSIIVFDEAKAVHEFDLGDVTGPMLLEVFLDFLLRDW